MTPCSTDISFCWSFFSFFFFLYTHLKYKTAEVTMRTDRQRYTDLNGLRHIHKYTLDTYATEHRLYNATMIKYYFPATVLWRDLAFDAWFRCSPFFLRNYQRVQFVSYLFEIEILLKTLWKFRLEQFEQLIFSNGDRILCKGYEYDVLYTSIFRSLLIYFLNLFVISVL